MKNPISLLLAFLAVVTPCLPQADSSALNIVVIEGEGAINQVKRRVVRDPAVQVEDENHKPVAGAAVTFFLPQQGASGVFANGARSFTVLTDDKGQAIAKGIKMNQVSGKMDIQVTAAKDGKSASKVISQNNVVPTAAISVATIGLIAAGAGAAAIIVKLVFFSGSSQPKVSVGTPVPQPAH